MLKISLRIGPIYLLTCIQSKILRKYLDKNFKKDFVRIVKILIEFFILFVLKKDDQLRLHVGYWKLNIVTIKDKYSLLNVGELHNYFSETKWFTKLNLWETYNLIKIKKSNEWKTIFKIRYEIYEYQIMLFGFINALTIY